MATPCPPPEGFPQQPFPPFPPQGQPMMIPMDMHPPPPAYSEFPPKVGAPPMIQRNVMNMMGPGPGMGYPPPQAFYAQLEFSDKSIRRAFFRKVYSLLIVHLLVTLYVISLFLFHPTLKYWTIQNDGVVYAALAIIFVTILAMGLCESVRSKSPQNFICLGVFTLAQGFVVGAVASLYNQTTIVLLAVAITAVITLAFILLSFQTKWDFTAHGGILFVAGVVLFIFGFLMIFLRQKFPIHHLVYACIGALVVSAYYYLSIYYKTFKTHLTGTIDIRITPTIISAV